MPAMNRPYPTATRRPVPLNRTDQNEERLRVFYGQTGNRPTAPSMQTSEARREQVNFVETALSQEQDKFWESGFHDSGLQPGQAQLMREQPLPPDQQGRPKPELSRIIDINEPRRPAVPDSYRQAQGDFVARSAARPQTGSMSAEEFYTRLNTGQPMTTMTREQREQRYIDTPGLTREERARREREVQAARSAEEHQREVLEAQVQAAQVQGADAARETAQGQVGAAQHQAAGQIGAAEAEANAAVAAAQAQRERFQLSPVGDVVDRDTGTITDRADRQETIQEMDFQDGTRGVFDGRTWIDKATGQPLHQTIPNFPVDPMVFMMLDPTIQKEMIDVWKQAFPANMQGQTGAAQPGAETPVGATAVNPQTGERMRWDGSQWVRL